VNLKEARHRVPKQHPLCNLGFRLVTLRTLGFYGVYAVEKKLSGLPRTSAGLGKRNCEAHQAPSGAFCHVGYIETAKPWSQPQRLAARAQGRHSSAPGS